MSKKTISQFILVILMAFVWLWNGGVFADHGDVKKGGYDLYWKNKIALAHDNAIINDSLVPIFLELTESLETNGDNGDIFVGSIRRTFSEDHYVGWILEVVDEIEVKAKAGEKRKFYRFEKQLVFDLRMKEKK